VQNDGSAEVGWGVCYGHGGVDGVDWGDGCGGGEDVGTVAQAQQVTVERVINPK